MTLESRARRSFPARRPLRGCPDAGRAATRPSRYRSLSTAAPALLVLAVIFLYPLLHSLWLSFHSLNLNRPWQGMRFVGLDNYTEQLSDPAFYHSLWLTFYWTAGSLIGQLVLGFAAALALNQTFAGSAVARAVILIPWAVPTVLVAIVFGTMFNTQGIVNELLLDAGLVSDYIPWLSSTTWAMPTLIMAHVWKGFPFLAVMILAGLQSIPQELYEAAEIDGATNVPAIALHHACRASAPSP